MIPAKFDYVRPSSLDDAVSALASGGEDAKVIAGGQSLLPLLRLRFSYPSVLVDVGGLDALRGVRDLGDSLEIGALTTHYELTRDPLIAAHCGLLAAGGGDDRGPGGQAPRHDRRRARARRPGRRPARRRHRARRDPGRDRARRRADDRAGDFFTDYLTTSLAPGEILTAIRVPKLDGWGYRYEKFHVTAQAWAIVGVAALARRSDGHVAEARVGLTNMGSVPVRAHAVEAAASGAEASAAALVGRRRQRGRGHKPAERPARRGRLPAPPGPRPHRARPRRRGWRVARKPNYCRKGHPKNGCPFFSSNLSAWPLSLITRLPSRFRPSRPGTCCLTLSGSLRACRVPA